MGRLYELGTISGLRLTAGTSVALSMAIIWMLTAFGAAALLDVPAGEAIAGGFVCALLHEISVLLHQFGHAWAARRTGYPMIGVRLWGALGVSIYPSDEGTLPPSVHIQRALGGPIGSFIVAIIAAGIALALHPWDQTPGWIAAFFFLDNLLVFTGGALMPLGFTDGSTLLHYWGK